MRNLLRLKSLGLIVTEAKITRDGVTISRSGMKGQKNLECPCFGEKNFQDYDRLQSVFSCIVHAIIKFKKYIFL